MTKARFGGPDVVGSRGADPGDTVCLYRRSCAVRGDGYVLRQLQILRIQIEE